MESKLDILRHFFADVQDKGTYYSCTMKGNNRIWMYSKKMIEELDINKLLKIIKNQTHI